MRKRLMDRLRGRRNKDGFTPELLEIWPDLMPQAGGQGELLAAAVTATWEVGLADIGRVLRETHPDRAFAFVERASDALVPLLTPIQALPKSLEQAVEQGGRQGQRSGKLLDAIAPTVAVVNGLPDDLEKAWAELVAYLELEPVPEVRVALEGIGSPLVRIATDAAKEFHTACGALPQEERVELAFMGALDVWRRDVARGLEIELYRSRTLILEAIAAKKP
ncbi:MAG: hypothetical protein ACI9VR_005023 [Cognaticolwellia sp.]|jgi:hypothetical protein